jgi:hypothetical protein
MLLVRLVNGVSDAFQKGSVASSVARLAVDKAGLPRWLVDMRHEASHNSLPSLSALQLAVQDMATWLLERYWRPQVAAVGDGLNAFDLPAVFTQYSRGKSGVADIIAAVDKLGPQRMRPGYCRHVVVPLLLDGHPQTVESPLFCTLAQYPVEGDSGPVVSASKFVSITAFTTTLPDFDQVFAKWVPVLQALYVKWHDFSSVFALAVAERLCHEPGPSGCRIECLLGWMKVMTSQLWWDTVEPGRFCDTDDADETPSEPKPGPSASKKRKLTRKERKAIWVAKQAERALSASPYDTPVSSEAVVDLDAAQLLPFAVLVEMCHSSEREGGKLLFRLFQDRFPPDLLKPRSWSLARAKTSAVVPQPVATAPVSLDDFERYLSAASVSVPPQAPTSSAVGDTVLCRDAWSVIDDWVPSPIGTLPGQPFATLDLPHL